jgi:hypothetical protein
MKLVFVHGIRQRGKDPTTLKREWLEALTDGLHRVGVRRPESTTTEFCFYGDVLGDFVDRVEARMTDDLAATRAKRRRRTGSLGPDPALDPAVGANSGHCQVILVGLVIRVYRSRVVRRF